MININFYIIIFLHSASVIKTQAVSTSVRMISTQGCVIIINLLYYCTGYISVGSMTDTKPVSSSVILGYLITIISFVQLLHNILYLAASMTKAQAVSSSSAILTSTQGYILIFVQLVIVININFNRVYN